jgi:hypothetical protein
MVNSVKRCLKVARGGTQVLRSTFVVCLYQLCVTVTIDVCVRSDLVIEMLCDHRPLSPDLQWIERIRKRLPATRKNFHSARNLTSSQPTSGESSAFRQAGEVTNPAQRARLINKHPTAAANTQHRTSSSLPRIIMESNNFELFASLLCSWLGGFVLGLWQSVS